MDPETKEQPVRGKVRSLMAANATKIIVAVFIAAFLVIYLSPSIFVTIYSGHAGVLFKRFHGGTVIDQVYPEGFHVLYPWNSMIIYDTRLQVLQQDMEVLSGNGLKIKLLYSVRYRPSVEGLPHLHKAIGKDYTNKVVVPVVMASITSVINQYRPDMIYTAGEKAGETYKKIHGQILDRIRKQTGTLPIHFSDIMIEKIVLPEVVNRAIEEKLVQEQKFLAYEYVLLKSAQEVKRKELEAKGIEKYNQVISGSFTPAMLKWFGIEATKKLAESANAKVVIVGGGRDGLPLILNVNEDQKMRPTENEKKPSTVQQNTTQ